MTKWKLPPITNEMIDGVNKELDRERNLKESLEDSSSELNLPKEDAIDSDSCLADAIEDEDIYTENRITRELDNLLIHAKTHNYKISSWGVATTLPGFGVSSSMKAWAKHNNIKTCYLNAPKLTLSKVNAQYMLANEPLEKEPSIDDLDDLFALKENEASVILDNATIDDIDNYTFVIIDHYDEALPEVREELFRYIHYRKLVDPRIETKDHLVYKNPLMLMVIINQINIGHDGPLTKEEIKLFGL